MIPFISSPFYSIHFFPLLFYAFLPTSILSISSSFFFIHLFPLLFYAFLPPSILYISYNLYVLITNSYHYNCFIFYNFVTFIYLSLNLFPSLIFFLIYIIPLFRFPSFELNQEILIENKIEQQSISGMYVQ